MLGRKEKVEQYIRKKTHKSNTLSFWVEVGVILLYVSSCLILEVSLLGFFQQRFQASVSRIRGINC